MLRKIIVTVCIILCFVLQCSVFDSLSFAGIIPNLMIVLTSSFGFMRGEREGLVIGFFCGLLTAEVIHSAGERAGCCFYGFAHSAE